MKSTNIDKLRQIRERLPQGSVKEIIRKTGYAQPTISFTLNGKMKSEPSYSKIILAAYEIIEEQYKIEIALNKKHNEMISHA